MVCLYAEKYELGITEYLNQFPEAYDKPTFVTDSISESIPWITISEQVDKFLTQYRTENVLHCLQQSTNSNCS
jgi:hypothetical protein